MDTFLTHKTIHWQEDASQPIEQDLLGEEPLSIRVQGNPYSVVLRTPGDEIAHVAGFCLGEGIIDSTEDYSSIAFCDGADTNVVSVTLKPSRRATIPEILDRRNYISQTSCGLCGKELVEDLYRDIKPLNDNVQVDMKGAFQCITGLSRHQPLRRQTSASHAAAIYSSDLELLSIAEDIGRHNALDKAIGISLLKHRLARAALLIVSSRISYELVQKAARAQIPVILSISRPTALAVELATELNITLASRSRDSGMYIYCGIHRLILESSP